MTGVRCTGTALLYSGRPDPRWEVGARQVKHLQDLWRRLPATNQVPHRAPALGYRGCAVECSSGRRLWAYDGFVESTAGDGTHEHRLDPMRGFEKEILATAPTGMLPRDGIQQASQAQGTAPS